MKRFTAFVTLVCMLISIVPYSALAYDTPEFVNQYGENFEYPDKTGHSVSLLDNWSVDNENLDQATTGSTVKLAKSPDDANNTVMHVKFFREYSLNQYANFTPEGKVSTDYAIYTAKYKLSDVADDYITYIKGEVTDTKGKTTAVNLTQLAMRAKGYFECIVTGIVSETTAIPKNRWFTLSVVYATKNQTYDVYLDGTKINESPVNIYSYNTNGATITAVNKVQLGIARYSKNEADMYVDDIKILTLDGDTAIGFDAEKISVPSTLENGMILPVKGEYFGSEISWKSSDTNVAVANNGVVTLSDVSEDASVTLTATVKNGKTEISKTFPSSVSGDKGRLTKITSKLNAENVSGQAYVKDNFTVNIDGLVPTDTVTVTSSDSNIISVNGSDATVTRPVDDTYVDLDITVTSALGNKSSKKVTLYVLARGIVFYYDGLNYNGFSDKQITGAGNWTVSNDNQDASVTGSTHTITTLSDDETDNILDIEVFRKYSGNNQVATLNQGNDLPGKSIVQMNLRFPGKENNRYIMYTTGTFINENETKNYASTSQIYFYPNTGSIYCETYRDENNKQIAVNKTPFAQDEWFNLKIEYDNVNRYYDVYINNVKQNTKPIYYARNVEGERVINQGNLRFGVHRDSGNPGHMYFDDLIVRAKEEEILNHELDTVRIPKTFVYDNPLPLTPNLFENVTLNWESSDESVITKEGKVSPKTGFGTTPVNLTVTATMGGVSKSKTYAVELVNVPAFTVDNMVFETPNGIKTYTPEAGGKIKNISITKYDTNTYNAKALVAVFDGNKLKTLYNPIDVTKSETIDLNLDIPEGDKIYVKAYVWNFDNMKPLSYTFRTANNLDEKISVFSMGDSTMQSYGDLADRVAKNDMTGWCQVLPMGTDSEFVEIRNYGRSGKSSKSFTEEGYIFKVYEGMKEGDYLIIQFGHNDQKSNDSTTPYNYSPLESRVADGTVPNAYKDAKTYEQWLREYVRAARIKGAYPVFATSIRRRQFDDEGKVKNSHEGYPEAMIELSKQLNVPLVDLHSKTETWMNDLGKDGSFKYYCISYNGSDNTHLTYGGAVEVANLAIEEMKAIGLPVSEYMDKFNK